MKCPHCQAALPDQEKELNNLKAEIVELKNKIEAAKNAETKEESDNIFD